MADLPPGTESFDYVIERLVGRGGFGAVYVARDKRLDRRVALKILDADLAGDPVARRRFIDESRLAASLDHPNIIPIYEAGSEDDQLYLAMRYVPGPDLEGILERDGALPPRRAAGILGQIASALDAAHAAGLVHRDVKPGNVLLTGGSDGADHAYLTDFGLSKRIGGAGAVSQTQAGQFVGTVGYVAPEQIRGRSMDARADVYSLGCLAYHVLTGHQPFERDSDVGVVLAHVEEPPPSVHATLPDIADRVDPVMARAMAKDAADRYPSAGAFAAELSAALAARGTDTTTTRGFLFADLRDYTAFIEAHGDDAAVSLLDSYRRLVRDVIARLEGAEIKTEGDSFYVVFPSASAAVKAGLGIVSAAAEQTDRPRATPIRVGVGVHAGESSEWIEGYVGSSVNIAARLCAQADPGEVLVSDTVRSLMRTSGSVGFVDRGKRRLKGIDEPMATWSAVPRDATQGLATPSSRTQSALHRVSRSPARTAIVALALLVGVAAVTWLLLEPMDGGSGAPDEAAATSLAGTGSGVREMVAFSRFVPSGPDVCRDTEAYDAKLMLVDLAATEPAPVRLTSATDLLENHPEWSADGTTMASVGLDQVGAPGLYVVDADGFREVPLEDPSILSGYNLTAALPGDGSFVAWKDSGRGADYHVVATDGSGSQTYVSGADESDTGIRSGSEDELVAIRTMPDGRLLSAWVMGYDPDRPQYTWRFETMATDGSDVIDIGPRLEDMVVNRLIVSPTGDRALLATYPLDDEEGAPDWQIMPLDGISDELEPVAIEAIAAGWSSDGTRLLMVPPDALGTLVEHELESGDEREVLDIGVGVICDPVARTVAPGTIGLPPESVPGEPLPFERALLEPGRYLIDRFQPAVEVTFGSGWLGRANFVDGWEVSHLGDPEAELSASRILVGLSGPCDTDEQVIVGSRPEDLIGWISSREDLDVSSPRQITIGGRPGISVDVVPVPGTECSYTGDWTLYLSGDDAIWVEPDEMLELTAVDIGGSTAVLLKRARQERMADFDELVDPVLESLEFVEDP